MLKAKRILIAAGGTGGHINPALSVAGYIRSQDPTAEILFVGTADKMEAKLVPPGGLSDKDDRHQRFPPRPEPGGYRS